MSKYWINPEQSNLQIDETKLYDAALALWEDEAEQILQTTSPVEAINQYLEPENLALDENHRIVALDNQEWLTETNLSTLHNLSGTFVAGTVLVCESDDNFELILTAENNGELDENIK